MCVQCVWCMNSRHYSSVSGTGGSFEEHNSSKMWDERVHVYDLMNLNVYWESMGYEQQTLSKCDEQQTSFRMCNVPARVSKSMLQVKYKMNEYGITSTDFQDCLGSTVCCTCIMYKKSTFREVLSFFVFFIILKKYYWKQIIFHY